jgi:hypothetical protein
MENLWIPVLLENLIKVTLCFIDTVKIFVLKLCAFFRLVLEVSGMAVVVICWSLMCRSEFDSRSVDVLFVVGIVVLG